MNKAEVILKLVELLVMAAPDFIQNWTQSRSPEEAIARARAALPDMLTERWDEDLARRIEQIQQRGQVPPEVPDGE